MTTKKSPGRKATAATLKGKRTAKKTYVIKGNVPSAVREDKKFARLFHISKEREEKLCALRDAKTYDIEAIRAAQDSFNEALNAVRGRWLELVPEDRPQ